MNRFLSLLSLLALLAFVPAACGGDGAAGETPEASETTMAVPPEETVVEPPSSGLTGPVFDFDPAASGGTLVVGQGQEPDTLYIYGGSMLAGTHVLNSIYDGPYEGLDYDYQAVILEKLPLLEDDDGSAVLATVSVEAGAQYVDPETQEVVTATETIEDLQQITAQFTLREGVTWQDGTPVTAEDSAFSQQIACHPDTPSSKFTCDRTASYMAIDERTAEWKGLPGFTDQTYFINFYTPLARHQANADGVTLAEMEPALIVEDETFTRMPFSYGPFMVAEWEAGDHITLTRNPHYWRSGEGLPFLDSVIHRFISDTNSLLAAVEAGDVHVATQDGLDISQSVALDAAEAAGRLTPWYVTGTVWEHIDFNLNPIDERVPLGACQQVRHAIAYGTNRAQMVDEIQDGKTTVQDTFVPAEHWGFPESGLVTYAFDPDMARQILDDVGFTGDGIRTAAADITCTITTGVDGATEDKLIPAGTPLSFAVNTTEGNRMREQTTLLFQQNMTDIGIEIELEYMPANVFFADGPDGPLFGRRFDLGEFAWLTGVQPPVGLYYCTEIPSEENSWAGQNETGWCNPEYDRVGKQASSTLEREASLPLYAEAQRIFTDELPVLPLFARVKVMATAQNVVNFAPNATVNSELWNVETWGFTSLDQ
jgi:peptide/nickel transport system substrate-binding protein